MNLFDFKIDINNFSIIDGLLHGKEVQLIAPRRQGVVWTDTNLIFRSSLWDKNTGEPISLGFKKFFNYGEANDIYPYPSACEKAEILEKVDGSLLIVSNINGEPYIRTRGSLKVGIDSFSIDKEILDSKYPLWASSIPEGQSYLYEYISPNNINILSYKDVDIKLLGVINHDDYSMFSQGLVDACARLNGVPRPTKYDRDHESLDDFVKYVSSERGIEGFCIYFNGGQYIRKVKTSEYVHIHSIMSGLASNKNFIKFYINLGRPNSFDAFKMAFIDQYDFECLMVYESKIHKLIEINNILNLEITEVQNKINEWIKNLSLNVNENDSRKKIALAIKNYWDDNIAMQKIAFTALDNKNFNTVIENILYDRFDQI